MAARFVIIQPRDLKFSMSMYFSDINLHAKNCGPVIHIFGTRGRFVKNEKWP